MRGTVEMCRAAALACTLALLAACSGDVGRLPEQHWGDITVQVEARPYPIRAGMTEFLVIATDAHGSPVSELRVSARAGDAASWTQLMQDGLSGVYRRAVLIEGGDRDLQLELRRDEQRQVLNIPLRR